jgi:hypothetical protein
VVAGLILVAGVVVALLQPARGPHGLLDPGDASPRGTHALAALLARRGQPVTRVITAAAAAREARAAGSTLVVTDPGLLSRGSLTALARLRTGLLLVAPTRAALADLAPEVRPGGTAPVRSLPPGCGLPAARLAGGAELGGLLLRLTADAAAQPGTWRCYPAGRRAAGQPGPVTAGRTVPGAGLPALVRYVRAGRTITVLGSGDVLTNASLGRDGNAALALNLLAPSSRVVWLVPMPGAPGTTASGARSLTSLLPPGVLAVMAQLGAVVLLAALWRARRFGPLIAEPLPVIVRAAETVTGHGRLYRARRARDRAAAALREAAAARITARLGLPPGSPPDVICHDLGTRTGRGPGQIQTLLFGPDPRDDAALVALAADLDTLERQVLSQ